MHGVLQYNIVYIRIKLREAEYDVLLLSQVINL